MCVRDSHRHNRGTGEPEARVTFGVMDEVGLVRRRREVNARSEVIFERTRELLTDALGGDVETILRILGGTLDATAGGLQ